MTEIIGVIGAIFFALCLLVVVLDRMAKAEIESRGRPFQNLDRKRKERNSGKKR
jgi:hypothetical protein